MDWAAIIVAVIAALVAIYTARQGNVAKNKAQALEQQKVDAEAYDRAQKITSETIARLEADLRYVNEQLAKTRTALTDAHRIREDMENQYKDELKQARNEWGILEAYFRRRITRLENALRDSGVPVPNGDYK